MKSWTVSQRGRKMPSMTSGSLTTSGKWDSCYLRRKLASCHPRPAELLAQKDATLGIRGYHACHGPVLVRDENTSYNHCVILKIDGEFRRSWTDRWRLKIPGTTFISCLLATLVNCYWLKPLLCWITIFPIEMKRWMRPALIHHLAYFSLIHDKFN